MYQVYQVTYNDTLDNIALKFNTTVDELMNINSNTNFVPGMYIVVPSINDNYDKYVIQKGDTIYKIASDYNIDPNTLILMNGLNKDDYIYPNDTLLVPRQGLNIYITNDNSTLNDLYRLGNLDELISYNSNIYLLPNQTILYRKEN